MKCHFLTTGNLPSSSKTFFRDDEVFYFRTVVLRMMVQLCSNALDVIGTTAVSLLPFSAEQCPALKGKCSVKFIDTCCVDVHCR